MAELRTGTPPPDDSPITATFMFARWKRPGVAHHHGERVVAVKPAVAV
jgi:hypothetical protein